MDKTWFVSRSLSRQQVFTVVIGVILLHLLVIATLIMARPTTLKPSQDTKPIQVRFVPQSPPIPVIEPDTDVIEPVTPKPVTPKPVTPKPVTPKPVTPKPVTPKPVTPKPVTPKPVTPKPVTPKPVTPKPVTPKPVTPKPVTSKPVTPKPVTAEPVTAEPVTAEPVTAEPVTAEPVTAEPVTAEPVTAEPVTAEPVTAEPVTAASTNTVVEARYSNEVQAEYPRKELKRGRTGTVSLSFVIGINGKAKNIQVINATSSAFEKAALEALQASTFQVTKINESAVEQKARKTITFDLD